MLVKDKLQIILITYNRAKHVQKTLEQFFFEGSPLMDSDFLVLDNNSTDNTQEIVKSWQEKFHNNKYSKNRYNLGISGNIAKAMEIAEKEYVWIIGDDDRFDFSNWSEVENAINNNEKIICLARYVLTNEQKYSIPHQLLQITFITGGIYSTTLFSDITIKNTFDNIFTLFPHLPPIIKYINENGKIYVVDKAIASNGMVLDETDCSYTRGISVKEDLYDRTNRMTWILGYANIITLLKDKKLQKECIKTAILYKGIYGSWRNFYKNITLLYFNCQNFNYFLEIYKVLPIKQKNIFNYTNNIFKFLFSIRNSKCKKYKIITILGLKLKIRKEF